MFHKLLLFFALFFFSLGSYTQSILNYSVSRSTGITYNSILSTGTPAAAWRNNGTFIPDDNRCYQEDIGFDFWHNGVRYTKFSISTNGFIDFSSSTANGTGVGAYGYQNTQFSTAGGTLISIAPFCDDQTTQGASDPLGTSIAYFLEGKSPNRILTIEWQNMAIYGNTTPDLNYQVKLYESTGVIEMVYGTMTNGTPTFSYSCGINGTVNTQLLTQQTANSTTFSSTAKNNLSTIPTSNSQLTFTPPTPTAVSGSLTFGAVTASSVVLNFPNWAANEVGYVIYYSLDDITFTYLTQTAVNAITYTATGLSPATIYYFKVYAVTEGALSDPLIGSQSTSAAGEKISVGTGNWATAGTWSPSGVPVATDNVTIADGHTITLNSSPTCNDLTIGQGISGTLQIGTNTTARTLTVNGNIVINTGATFNVNAASNTTHTLTVKKDLTNNGTFNMATDAGSLCNVTFSKNGSQTVSGTGSTTNFNLITQNMGTSSSNILDIASSNFTAASNFLTLTNGTFKLSAGNTATHTPFTAASTIATTCGLWINSATSTVNTGASLTATGDLTISAGILNIGNAADENLISGGGQITVSGGTLNIAGRFDRTFGTTVTKLNISGGNIIVPTVGSTSTTLAPLQMDVVGSIFTMSGGTIIIERAGNPGGNNLGLIASSGTLNVTGGTLQIGDASTPAAQTISINSSVSFANLTINSANATAVLTNNFTIFNDFTITTGTFNCSSFIFSLGRHWSNTGTFTSSTGTINLNGTGTQTITKSGGETFYKLTVNKTSGNASLANDIAITNTLTLTSGNIDCGIYTTTLGTSTVAAGTLTYTSGNIVGKFKRWLNTMGIAVYFPIGTSTNSRLAQFNFTNLVGGTLLAEFMPADPGSNGLPLSESGMSIANQYSDGYWDLTAANGLSSTNYSLYLTGIGFSNYTITSSTRLLYRATIGNAWSLNGTHIAAASDIVKRSGINGLSAQFAFGKSNCTVPVTSTITGNTSVCTNASGESYSVTNTSGNTYAWVVNLGSIASGQGTNSITVNWGATSGTGSVQVTETNLCGDAGTAVNNTVYVNPITTSAISGAITAAANETGVAYSVTNTSVYSYTWLITGGTQASGGTTNAITVDWGAAGAGNVQVTATRLCGGTDNKNLAVTIRGTIVSNASGNWATGGTWVGGIVPANLDYVQIASGHTVTMNSNPGACYKLTIDGIATWTSEFTSNVGNGGIEIGATGDITGTVNGTLTSTGGLTINNTLTTQNVNIVLQTTANQTIAGTGNLAKLAINASTTNTGILTVTSALSGSNTLTNGTNATLNINCSSITISGITASSSGNTVNYAASNIQTLKSTTYTNLGLSGSNTKSLSSALVVNGNLSISSVALDATASNYNITLQGNWTNTGTFLPHLNTVTFNGNSPQTITNGTTETFNNLQTTGSGTKTLAGNIKVNDNFTNSSTLDASVSNYTLEVLGNWDNNGSYIPQTNTTTFAGNTTITGATLPNYNNVTISGSVAFPSGSSISVNGNWINNGTFSHPLGTVNFNGNTTVSGSSVASFNNIVIGGSLTSVLNGNLNVSGNFTNNGAFNNNNGTVTFNGTSTISGTTVLTTFNNLAVSNLSSLNIGVLKQVTAAGTLTNNGTLSLKSDATGTASLLENGIAGTGTFSDEQYITGTRWWYISSPMANEFSGVYNATNTIDNGIFYFDEPTGAYIRITNNTTALNPAKGYATKFKNVASRTNTYQGNINTGASSLNLTGGGSGGGWNLAGNPYPSAIDWEAASGWTKTNVGNTIYYRSNGTYATYSSTSHLGTNGGTRYIPAMQAFWVKCISSIGTLSMINSVRIHNPQALLRQGDPQNTLRVTAERNGNKDEMVMNFNAVANDNFDIYDSEKMFGGDITFPQVYVTLDGNKKTAIDVMSSFSTDKDIPLGFKVGTAGTYNFTFESLETFDANANFYLEDKLAKAIIDLKENPKYTFASAIVDDNTRFIIHFKAPGGLPVSLISFDAEYNSEKVDIVWTTSSEVNNKSFVVERSSDGNKFEQIYATTGAGNSNELIRYATADFSPLTGISYYRLKQIDFDGISTFSSIVQISNSKEKTDFVDDLVVTKEKLSFSMKSNNSSTVKIKIIDNSGNIVIINKIAADNNSARIDISDLSSATYILQIESDDQLITRKFFKP